MLQSWYASRCWPSRTALLLALQIRAPCCLSSWSKAFCQEELVASKKNLKILGLRQADKWCVFTSESSISLFSGSCWRRGWMSCFSQLAWLSMCKIFVYRCWALFSNKPPPNLSNLSKNLYLHEFSIPPGTPLWSFGVYWREIFSRCFFNALLDDKSAWAVNIKQGNSAVGGLNANLTSNRDESFHQPIEKHVHCCSIIQRGEWNNNLNYSFWWKYV